MNRKKELHINLQDESNPSDEFLSAIKEAEEEYKSGKIKKFRSIDKAVAHLKQI